MKKLIAVSILLATLCTPAYADKNVVEYKTVAAGRLDKLDDKVNAMIELGWEPQGGINKAYGGYYFQAMVRYIRNDEEGKNGY